MDTLLDIFEKEKKIHYQRETFNDQLFVSFNESQILGEYLKNSSWMISEEKDQWTRSIWN